MSTPPHDPNHPYSHSGHQGGYPQYPGGPGGQPPGQPPMHPAGEPPANYLVFAILTTLFCCLPLGAPAIAFAAQVNNKWAIGDYQGAQDASNKAKNFSIWSAVVGAVSIIIYLIFVFTTGAAIFGSLNLDY